ncbi:hypothetical protein B0T44_20405 [Nocardia donostiensis]|nr:hypothetical protein B0T36_05990 [Nocardia donostiensis]OQS18293.1 hypothetical protein B0T44_20405 [Nocardia donostiensis]
MELAAEFGRIDGAIRARCHLLLPPDRRAEANSKRLAVQLLGTDVTTQHLTEGGRAEELDITLVTRTPNTA